MNRAFLQAAMRNMGLFKPSSDSRELVRRLSLITGIPVMRLLVAEREMAMSGSLAPLKALLCDPERVRRDRLRFTIGMRQLHQGKGSPREAVTTRIELTIGTVRGRVDVALDMLVRRKRADFRTMKQEADIKMTWKLRSLAGSTVEYKQRTALEGHLELPPAVAVEETGTALLAAPPPPPPPSAEAAEAAESEEAFAFGDDAH